MRKRKMERRGEESIGGEGRVGGEERRGEGGERGEEDGEERRGEERRGEERRGEERRGEERRGEERRGEERREKRREPHQSHAHLGAAEPLLLGFDGFLPRLGFHVCRAAQGPLRELRRLPLLLGTSSTLRVGPSALQGLREALGVVLYLTEAQFRAREAGREELNQGLAQATEGFDVVRGLCCVQEPPQPPPAAIGREEKQSRSERGRSYPQCTCSCLCLCLFTGVSSCTRACINETVNLAPCASVRVCSGELLGGSSWGRGVCVAVTVTVAVCVCVCVCAVREGEGAGGDLQEKRDRKKIVSQTRETILRPQVASFRRSLQRQRGEGVCVCVGGGGGGSKRCQQPRREGEGGMATGRHCCDW